MDGWSRLCIVGWATAARPEQHLALEALQHAIRSRRPHPGLLHHSDRGGQYASANYQELLDRHGMICSMSRPGNCLDNAVVESFFHTLKTEWLYHHRFRTRAQARLFIFDYIEGFYNRTRLHSALGYHSPEQHEILSSVAYCNCVSTFPGEDHSAQATRNWVRQAARDDGHRADGLITAAATELKATPA